MSSSAAQLGQKRDRALLSSALATLMARGVNAFSLVLILAVAAHALSRPELGVVAVLTTISAFLSFGDFGLGTLLMTRLPQAHARGDTEGSRHVLGVTLSTLCVTGGFIAAGGALSCIFVSWSSLLGANSLPAHQIRDAVICFFVFGGLGIPATVGNRVLVSMLRSGDAQLWLAGASAASLVLTDVCSLEHLPIWCYVAAVVGGPACIGIAQTAWVLLRLYPNLIPARFGVPPGVAWSYLRASSVFAIMSLSAVISYSIDSLVVSSIMGASAAAVFAVAARMFALVGVTIGLAGQQLWSALTDAITRGDNEWARSRFWRILLISTAMNSVGCAFLVVFGRVLARWWVGADLVPPRSLLIVLAIYTVYSTTVVQASYLLAAVERVRLIAGVGVIMAVVNLGASIVLTHRYGLSGPIMGSIVALVLVMTIPLIVQCRRELSLLDGAIAVPRHAVTR